MEEEIKKLIEGEVSSTRKMLDLYSHDTSLFEVRPELIVFPKNPDDIKKLVKYVTQKKSDNQHIAITARSGGTDMSGGSINDSIILAFEKHFNKIGTIRNNKIKVEPGVYYRNFDKKTKAHKKIMPSYPASREICMVGGMVANNAGGEKSLVYGKTERYVRSLKVVLADGNEYTIKPLKKEELDKKIKQSNFEGVIYKQLFKLLDDNYEHIKNSKPPVTKNSTAYNLWNIWDRETGVFDLTQLFVGSQGTIGIITEIEFGLVDYKPESGLLVGYVENLHDLAKIIQVVLKHKPTSFEAFDDQTIKFATRFFFQFIKTLGFWKWLKTAIAFIPDALILAKDIIFERHFPRLVMLVEFEGTDQDEITNKLHDLKLDLKQFDLDTEIADTKGKSERYWLMRRESFNLLRKNVKNKHTAPFIDDLVVPPYDLPKFIPELEKVLEKYNLLETIVGHIGDGNFHIIPLMDLTDKKERDKIEPCLNEVIKLVKKYNGSISGEHNDGLIRGPFIEKMYGKKMFDLFVDTKKIMDPYNIFNPHKKTDATWKYSHVHMRDHF